MKTRSYKKNKFGEHYKLQGKSSSDEAGSENQTETYFQSESGFKRQRKTKEQMKILQETIFQFSHWNKRKVADIARKTGLRKGQVYKWQWDYRKKMKENVFDREAYLYSTESLKIPLIEWELERLERNYKKSVESLAAFVTPSRFLSFI